MLENVLDAYVCQLAEGQVQISFTNEFTRLCSFGPDVQMLECQPLFLDEVSDTNISK